ncbi:1,3-beta-galactosyl-N-acetylhexosamine phosphorylase [Paenibacillus donghaensis]|uniref:1,3-beta-galactosyl-N-acetylhexosamine phosphorylase n=1 Tax=Paenibacillus donghaensis TaxID=414771 RepID=A0A2Z2KNR6_9BACL|nr:1,3-beta-galactosyl-N-acetylhexosamine phosphorylase [Paenibacillus donghaensis]ASA20428.1 1,3-beta-galactosyl-N-acetylhexosamine phosphorylase [Paenibacillus donghaensis]
MALHKGRVTLPSEEGFVAETKEMMERWGADAIRDSDGTKLDEAVKSLDARIYTAYFPSRGHNEFIEQHMEECPQIFLLSDFCLARQETLEIEFLKPYYRDQLEPDYIHDPKHYWQVTDRTSGDLVPASDWDIAEDEHKVMIRGTVPWHEYTVSFLAYIQWDPVQMYNHITNDWGDKPHEIPFDVKQPHSNAFIYKTMKQWLEQNPEVDVVRFTTLFYQFSLVFNQLGKEKFVDWFGYGASVSVAMLEDFRQEKGYALTAEDFVDQGYYNSSFRIPTIRYLEYVDFVSRFVSAETKKLVDLVHAHRKEAIMFLGDQWIGTEPYGPYFESIGLDAVVGSVGDGTTLRMISDIPHVKYTEGRFLPYFFPDVFHEGNDPVIEANGNWLSARRAILRKPIDRMGYGGYLSLAYKFPRFIDYVEKITDEFREIHEHIQSSKPYSGLKVAVLNCWGALRTWQAFTVAHSLYSKQAYSYYGILESLSGMNVDVQFISFDDVLANGIDPSLDVIINAGDAHTAFSGGEVWKNAKLVELLREWVYGGGGLIGVGEPAAVPHQGRYFQLADCFGVDKELGFSVSTDKYFHTVTEQHFITADQSGYAFGESMRSVYALHGEVDILEYSEGEIHLSANQAGAGRAVYIAGLPYSPENTRLLMRSLYYAAGREQKLERWYAANLNCEVHAYPQQGVYAVVNNTNSPQRTVVYDGDGNSSVVELGASEIQWKPIH